MSENRAKDADTVYRWKVFLDIHHAENDRVTVVAPDEKGAEIIAEEAAQDRLNKRANAKRVSKLGPAADGREEGEVQW